MSEDVHERHNGTETVETYGLPFPPRFNPHHERVLPIHLQWMRSRGLVTHETLDYYRDSAYPGLVAHVFPYASPGTMEVLSQFMGWIAFYDDQFDGPAGRDRHRAAALIQGCLQVMECHPAHAPVTRPLDRAFTEIWAGMVADRSARWQERFKEHWRAYLSAYVHEASIRGQGLVQSLEEYDQHRTTAGAILLSFDLIEVAGGYELPPALYETPQLTRMRSDAGYVICLANDLASLARESDLEEVVDNRVLLLEHHHGTTRGQAVTEVEELIRTYVNSFTAETLRLRENPAYATATPTARHDTEQFIHGMGDWMRGNFDWQARTARYHGRWQVLEPGRESV
ncbi:hypothetical protein [Streptomyces sp. NPDC058620]|uniref:terpene synthase family protein n=1 Tax=Streptomyces sp. NPDC058620 TaxID=3346560 RepID=UPI0036630F1B